MNRRLVFFSLVFSVVLVLLVAEFITSSKAAFTTPLTVNFTYPTASSGTLSVNSSGTQQVFRLGSVAPTSIFAGLDPKLNTSPPGTSLVFSPGYSASTVGATDFVYAIQVRNNSNSTGPIRSAFFGVCENTNITSVGYVKDSRFISPTFNPIFTGDTILSFFNIPINRESVIIFFTSPDPPALVDTTVTSSLNTDTVSPDISKGIYGSCPVTPTVDIQAGCTIDSVSNSPVTTVSGGNIYYQVEVVNPNSVALTNIKIFDSSTTPKTEITSLFTIDNMPFTGTLSPRIQPNPPKIAKSTFSEIVNTSGTKNITVEGEYLIPNPDGTPSNQSFSLPDLNSSISDSINYSVIAQPSLASSFVIAPENFITLTQTLTYTMKATNAGASPLFVSFDLTDANGVNDKLKAILALPPPGLTISPVSFPTPVQLIAAGITVTTEFTITVNTVAGWQVLADAMGSKTSSTKMTVKASPATAGSVSCNDISQTILAQTTFAPPCKLDVLKTVACDLGVGKPSDSNFSATATVLPNGKVYYRYKVTNSSLLDTINGISLTDPLLSAPVAIGSLAPGEMTTVDIMATVPNAIPSNTTITVNSSCANNVVTSGLKLANPVIEANKSVNGAIDLTGYTPGTELVWQFTAKNPATSGVNVNLTIDDPLLRGLSGVIFKRGNTVVTLPYLATNVIPGESIIITAAKTFSTVDEFKAVAEADGVLRNEMNVTGEIITPVCGTAILQAKAKSTIRLFTPPTTEVCIIRTCEPNCPPISPASEAVMKAQFSDDKPGSLLLYNLYTSSSTGDPAQNTRLSLTNLGSSTTFAHLFFIDGTTCNVSDTFTCLSPNQTTSFLASEIDPGVTGYVVAIAVNEEGCPVSFNHLIGSSHVKFASGHTALLNAQAVAALYSGVLSNCTSSMAETVIKLDGMDYGLAPTTLVANTIFSQADKQSTMLIVNPVGGNLNTADSVNTIGTIAGQVFDESERGFSFVAPVNRCQLQATMNDSFPRIPTRLSKVISSGKVGMMRFATNDKAPIAGSIITFNPDAKLNALGFNQGHNLHYSALTNKATYTIPIFRPHI